MCGRWISATPRCVARLAAWFRDNQKDQLSHAFGLQLHESVIKLAQRRATRAGYKYIPAYPATYDLDVGISGGPVIHHGPAFVRLWPRARVTELPAVDPKLLGLRALM